MDMPRAAIDALGEAGVLVAYLFGSRADGRPRPTSDVDVAVLFGRPTGLLERERLAGRLQDVLGAEVDLVVLDDAHLEIRGRVVQTGRLIHSADEPRRVAFEVDTRSRYLDYLPTLRRMTRAYLEKVAERGADGRGR